jgi:riboflavin kinase/FMN adenylyltransferase
VTNVGCKPTVNSSGKISAETHILNFNGDLYGRRIRVSFYKKIREERKFTDLNVLSDAILSDIESTRAYFNLMF